MNVFISNKKEDFYMNDYFVGKTIIIRKAKESDLDNAFKNIWSDKSLFKYMFYDSTENIEEAKKRLDRTIEYQKNNYAYFICLKETDEVIGFCGMKDLGNGEYQETGVAITSRYQSSGIGKEVSFLMLDYVFNTLKGEKFICECMENNVKSKGLIKLLGFKLFDTYSTVSYYDNLEHVIECYYLDKETYFGFINR